MHSDWTSGPFNEGAPDLTDRFESGAHMTLYDRDNQLSFTYYPGQPFIYVAIGGYGEPNVLRIPLRYNTVLPPSSMTITEFERICKRHCLGVTTPPQDDPF